MNKYMEYLNGVIKHYRRGIFTYDEAIKGIVEVLREAAQDNAVSMHEYRELVQHAQEGV